MSQKLARGVFLSAVALFFASNASRLSIGSLVRPGPGMFPLIVSSLLFVLGVITMIQSRRAVSVPLQFSFRNIAMIMLGLCLFVIASTFIDMLVGITLLVFVAGFAATTYSWKRNVQISIGLILVALAFQKLLGLNLQLI